MPTTLETKLKISSWDEKPYLELADDTKFTKTDVVLTGTGDISSARYAAVMYYRPDGTSSYVSLMHVTANLGGRSGTFVLQGEGTYDGTRATGTSIVVEGSGTDDLTSLAGSADSVSTHEDYPYMPLTLSYSIG